MRRPGRRRPAWAPESQAAVSPFRDLSDGLTGVSDRVLRDHVRVADQAVERLRRLDRPAGFSWASYPASIPHQRVQEVLRTRVCDLGLVFGGAMIAALSQVELELADAGIGFVPRWCLGDGDFWTADGATSVNIPWWAANDEMLAIVNANDARLTMEDIVRILRHEAGHAFGYAHALGDIAAWTGVFGDMDEPYPEGAFERDPGSTDYVLHLHDLGGEHRHYAQKHPDEDWAETFAVWLANRDTWRSMAANNGWSPVVVNKMETVERIAGDLGSARPLVTRAGLRVPLSSLTFTVGEYLGVRDPAEEGIRARAAAAAWADVYLHEVHFGALRRGAGAVGPFAAFSAGAVLSHGSVDAWRREFLALARDAGDWALTVWDVRERRLRNVVVGDGAPPPPGCPVLLALCCHAHAYAGDVGHRKDVYVASWLQNVDWSVVEDRLVTVQLGLQVVMPAPAPAAATVADAVLAADPVPTPEVGG